MKTDTTTASNPDKEIKQGLVNLTTSNNLTQMYIQRGNKSRTPARFSFVSNPILVKSTVIVPGISNHDIVIRDLEKKHITKKHHQENAIYIRKQIGQRFT